MRLLSTTITAAETIRPQTERFRQTKLLSTQLFLEKKLRRSTSTAGAKIYHF